MKSETGCTLTSLTSLLLASIHDSSMADSTVDYTLMSPFNRHHSNFRDDFLRAVADPIDSGVSDFTSGRPSRRLTELGRGEKQREGKGGGSNLKILWTAKVKGENFFNHTLSGILPLPCRCD